MRATIDATELKRVLNNTKKFVDKRIYANKCLQYIYLELDAGSRELKATAVDGHKISVEYACLMDIDESFKCFIKPDVLPKFDKNEQYAELELQGDRLLITIGGNLTGYKQPDLTYLDMKELLNKFDHQCITSVYFDAKLLVEALQSVSVGGTKNHVKIEIPDKPSAPVIIRPDIKDNKNFKLVLPVNSPNS